MIPTFERTMQILATARGWLDGFAAARPAAIDEGNGSHARLRDRLDEVAEHMARMQDGKFRTLVPGRLTYTSGTGMDVSTQRHDGGLVIVTYAELEMIYDGIVRPIHRGSAQLRHPEHADRVLASSTILKIISEFQAEADLYDHADEVPF